MDCMSRLSGSRGASPSPTGSLRSNTIPAAAARRASARCSSQARTSAWGAGSPRAAWCRNWPARTRRPERSTSSDDRRPGAKGCRQRRASHLCKGHFYVETGQQRLHRVPETPNEVRHCEALEAPFVTQNAGEQSPVLPGPLAVDRVVGAHHRIGPSLDHCPKGRQVDFVHASSSSARTSTKKRESSTALRA